MARTLYIQALADLRGALARAHARGDRGVLAPDSVAFPTGTVRRWYLGRPGAPSPALYLILRAPALVVGGAPSPCGRTRSRAMRAPPNW
jgi:hypothetical protein